MIRSTGRAIVHFLEGVAIGAANVVPGVSGGTMALIFGIYERLIDLLGSLFRAGLRLVRFDASGSISILRGVDWPFLAALFGGILVAPVLGAALIPDLMRAWPEASRSLFFGLILGSLPIPWLRIHRRSSRNIMVALVAAAISFVLVGVPPRELADPGLLAVFLSAAVAICAMILPGISGAFLLLVLGMYDPVLSAVDARDWTVILVFCAGAGLGLGSFALGLKALLARAHDATMAALVGLMAGSLRSLWPWLAENRDLRLPATGEPLMLVVLLGAAGFVISGGITLWEMRRSALSGAGDAE
jgi:putative membrane protein